MKSQPSVQESWVRSLGREDPLEKEMAIHSSIPAWRIPWTSLVGYSPWGHKELDMTKWLTFTFTFIKSTTKATHGPTALVVPACDNSGIRQIGGTEGALPWLWPSLPPYRFKGWERGLSEKAMAPHSSVLAWRIPGTEEPSGLPSMESHRVRHDWSNLAVAVAEGTISRGDGAILIY